MALSSLKFDPVAQKLRCAVRHAWVAAQPEEWVRQRILLHMIEVLGYPKGMIAVEQHLRTLASPTIHAPHTVPDRRVDILVSERGRPLLLVECKAVPLSSKVWQQVHGYNRFVGARFLTIANEREVQTGWHDERSMEYRYDAVFPAFQLITQDV